MIKKRKNHLQAIPPDLGHRTLISKEIEEKSLPCAFKEVGVVGEKAGRHSQALSRVQRDLEVKLRDTKMNYGLSGGEDDSDSLL